MLRATECGEVLKPLIDTYDSLCESYVQGQPISHDQIHQLRIAMRWMFKSGGVKISAEFQRMFDTGEISFNLPRDKS